MQNLSDETSSHSDWSNEIRLGPFMIYVDYQEEGSGPGVSQIYVVNKAYVVNLSIKGREEIKNPQNTLNVAYE